MFLANNLNKGGGAAGGYQISRSLRFNRADSAYLNRTPASDGNRTAWTYSFWIKRSGLSTEQHFIGSSGIQYYFSTGNALVIVESGSTSLITTQVFRDTSAWYHIVIVWDSANSTSGDRVRLYVNGSRVTAFDTATYPAQNTQSGFNQAIISYIGRYAGGGVYYFDGYQTETNFIDGQALTPSSFGETNAQTGVWQPKAYSGSYGTNGFYLNFSDNSNTTAATLGKDYSGNGNNWTPNNFSVTAGSGNDSVVDSPTSYGTDTGVGGTVRGNYATLNPLKKKSVATISNGNLALVATSAVYVTGLSTISPSSGTYYMEMLCSGSNSNRPWAIGVVNANASADASMSDTGTYFVTNNSGSTVNYYLGGSPTALSTSSTWVAGDIISLAWNVDSGKFWVGLNGVWYPSSTGGTVASNADVAAGNYPTFTISYSGNTNPQVIPAFVTYDTTASIDANFGQRPFAYTAPSGYKALCTQNLPTPAIGATTATQAGKFFAPVIYTPTSYPAVTTGVGFQPDFTWWKNRVRAEGHILWDVLRGSNLFLRSNTTAADDTQTNGWVANSDGWTSSSGSYTLNEAYVAWNWKANGSGSTNTAGSITSTVSANTTSGFSIATWTGITGSATVGHGLGVAPAMVIYKARGGASSWVVLHQSLTNMSNYWLKLNTADAELSGIALSANPTSSVIYTNNNIFANGDTVVTYCFAEIAGYSKISSYTGNGSADGVFVYCGFRPAYVMIKETSAGYDWIVEDSARDTYNVSQTILSPNNANADASGSNYYIDFLSNGFKIRSSYAGINANGVKNIFAAFATAPFKYSLAR